MGQFIFLADLTLPMLLQESMDSRFFPNKKAATTSIITNKHPSWATRGSAAELELS
jgi:hypothetical protein